MTWEITQDLLKLFGPVVTGLLVLLWLNKTGQLRWGREAEQSERDSAADRADWEKREAQLRQDFERQMATLIADWQQREAALTKDRDFYRDKSWELMDRWAGDLDQAEETAASVAARVSGRRR